jgi:hypothetical protein
MEAKIKKIPFFKARHWSHGVGVSGVFTWEERIFLEIGTTAATSGSRQQKIVASPFVWPPMGPPGTRRDMGPTPGGLRKTAGEPYNNGRLIQ